MPQKDLTEIVCIIDRSGSMQSISSDAQGGFDAFIEAQQKEEGKAAITLAQFDNEYEMVWENRPLEEIKKGDYLLMPRGSTALLDAIGKTVQTVGERLHKTAESARPEKVLLMIITDGMENHSKEYNRTQIMDMISHQRDTYKWEFLFLAANQDAIKEAAHIGIQSRNAMNFMASASGVSNAYDICSAGVSKYRRTGKTDLPDNAEDVSAKPKVKKSVKRQVSTS